MAESQLYEEDDVDLLMEFEVEDEEDEEDDAELGEEIDSGEDDDGDDEEIQFGPWMYEPLPKGQPGENVGDAAPDADPDRKRSTENWCTCRQCIIMETFSPGDCTCREIPEVSAEADEQGVLCLTEAGAFEPAILNPISLYIGWMEYTERWRQAARDFGQRNNEKYRYVAYRKVVRWCWGYLGRNIRVQLPACIHATIMNAYPDGRNQYKGTILRVLRV